MKKLREWLGSFWIIFIILAGAAVVVAGMIATDDDDGNGHGADAPQTQEEPASDDD